MKWLLDFLKENGSVIHCIPSCPRADGDVSRRAHSGFSGGAKLRAGLIQPDIVWTRKIEPRDRKVGVLLTKNHDQKT